MPTSRKRHVRHEIEDYDMPERVSQVKSVSVLERLTPVLLIASIFLAFAVGVLWQKVQNLEKGGSGTAALNNQGAAPSAPTDPSGKLTEDQLKTLPKVTDADHIRGSKDAQVFLIEYSDYQCPYCEQFFPTAQQVLKEYGNKVAWVYRQFPLEQIHPNARPSAEASECVAALGGNDAFWKFTDLIFGNQAKYLTNLQTAAVDAGVNGAQFKDCFASTKYKDRVDSQLQGGVTAGVNGTPANFIINNKGQGWLIPGALPFAQIKTTIDLALKG
jgi:protein-disulfide isomerase